MFEFSAMVFPFIIVRYRHYYFSDLGKGQALAMARSLRGNLLIGRVGG
jgi:hypothetical protein